MLVFRRLLTLGENIMPLDLPYYGYALNRLLFAKIGTAEFFDVIPIAGGRNFVAWGDFLLGNRIFADYYFGWAYNSLLGGNFYYCRCWI